MVSGFIRIFIEKNYRKSLDGNGSLLKWINEIDEINENKKELNIEVDKSEKSKISEIKGVNVPSKITKVISKRKSLILRNQYAMKNQLQEMIIKK
jgi:hypothetical protein